MNKKEFIKHVKDISNRECCNISSAIDKVRIEYSITQSEFISLFVKQKEINKK